MAKRVHPVKILPPHSSSDDETQDQDGSGGTDDEQQLTLSQKTLNQEPQNEDSGDETEEDDDSKADLDETQNLDEKGSKSKVSNGEGESVGKVKNGSKSGQVEEKKSVFKWSEDDEVALLDEIIDYKVETGEGVNSNMVAFHEYVKDLFSVMKIQLYEKITRLKNKFQTNEDKWKNGEEPVFSKQHDSVLFELSKRIWGSEGSVTDGNDKKDGNVVGNTSTPVEPVTSREHFVQEGNRDTFMEDEMEVTEDYWSLYPSLCASIESEAAGYLSIREEHLNEYVKKIISGFGEEKARKLEDEWKAVQLMDHQRYARRVHLISKQAQVVSDFFNQSG